VSTRYRERAWDGCRESGKQETQESYTRRVRAVQIFVTRDRLPMRSRMISMKGQAGFAA
jgi:hypothetical protein